MRFRSVTTMGHTSLSQQAPGSEAMSPVRPMTKLPAKLHSHAFAAHTRLAFAAHVAYLPTYQLATWSHALSAPPHDTSKRRASNVENLSARLSTHSRMAGTAHTPDRHLLLNLEHACHLQDPQRDHTACPRRSTPQPRPGATPSTRNGLAVRGHLQPPVEYYVPR